jgi:hypothetical protein
MNLAWASDRLLGCDDVMRLVLRSFTHDEANDLKQVCKKFQLATSLSGLAWRLFTDEAAALDRIRRHFAYPELHPPHVLAPYTQVCAVVRTLYGLHSSNSIFMGEGAPGLRNRSVIGFRTLHVNQYRAWNTDFHRLATTHPAFTAVPAGDSILAVYQCIRSLGFMPVPGTGFNPQVFALLDHELWTYTRTNAYIEQLRRRSAAALRVRVGREAAAVARQWSERRARRDARLARLSRQLA